MVSQDTMEAMSELINRSFQYNGISLYARLDVREHVMGCQVGLPAGGLAGLKQLSQGLIVAGSQRGCPLLKSPGWGQ